MFVVHYCCGSYANGLFGGVPRYDHQIALCFPSRIFFVAPLEREHMKHFVATCSAGECLVIVDNHHALDVPLDTPCIVVHHGCAQEHAERAPSREDLIPMAKAQGRIWAERSPENTRVISISTFCTEMFMKHNGDSYARFDRILVLHSTEHDESLIWKPPHSLGGHRQKIRVLGNFNGISKGSTRIKEIEHDGRIDVKRLQIYPIAGESVHDFQLRKQREYASCDVFLQLSVHEGNSFASLDAVQIGMPIVATNVGLFYKDAPCDSFVSIGYRASADEIIHAILEADSRSREIGANARHFYMQKCRFRDWCDTMQNIVQGMPLEKKKKHCVAKQ